MSQAPADAFDPHGALARELFGRLDPPGSDGSHDRSHILRVWRNAAVIARTEPGCDVELLVAAVILHDCVVVEKDSPLRALASRLSAARAREIVAALGWTPVRQDALAHVIETHSFSASLEPLAIEAFILQDADRLDAIGAIGIARCFYVGGRLGSALYDPDDPDASARDLNDRRYALDHFPAKLFKVATGFRTVAGRQMAERRAAVMRSFVTEFLGEIASHPGLGDAGGS
jgi:uncharacterized protein